jgi:hypothetical protein
MSLDTLGDTNGRRSTPVGININDCDQLNKQFKDINLSDSKIQKSKIATNQNDIFSLLDMTPPEVKKQQSQNPEVTGFQTKRSEKTSATGSQLSQDSPTRLLKDPAMSRIPLYKRLTGRI